MTNRMLRQAAAAFSLRTFVVLAASLAIVTLSACGFQRERVLDYGDVLFVEKGVGQDVYYCRILDNEGVGKILITRPDGESRRLEDTDEAWAADGEAFQTFVRTDGKRHSHIRSNWIDIHIVDYVPVGPFLFDGASLQVGDSKPLKLPASEKQIRDAFGRPNKVTHRKQRSAV